MTGPGNRETPQDYLVLAERNEKLEARCVRAEERLESEARTRDTILRRERRTQAKLAKSESGRVRAEEAIRTVLNDHRSLDPEGCRLPLLDPLAAVVPEENK